MPELDFHSQNLPFIESIYSDYLRDPNAVTAEWREFFDEVVPPTRPGPLPDERPFPKQSVFNRGGGFRGNGVTHDRELDIAGLQERLDQLIRNYRVRGHIVARLDPLGKEHPAPPELDPAFYGFDEKDYDRPFSTEWFGGPEVRTLREMMQWMRNTYCRSIGVQFMHIDSLRVRNWLQERMESTSNRLKLSREEQLRILVRLCDAVVLEEFIQKKYVGAKSFSLEGAESLIPLLDLAIEKAGEDDVKEIVFGMAHRGRLNVLANIMGKSPRAIFREFEDKDPELHFGRGDVKYHLGYSWDWTTSIGKNVHLSLCFNPSHLEFVNPVALGRMRAKQDRAGDKHRRHGCVILIHGDAAFAGEGVVQETLNLSELDGYRVGGAIHVIVNNQIGFTTSEHEARSTTYATDVAKMLQSPIFHVNGEDPEAVAQVVRLALDFRKEFQRDVVIDMYCYRRRGHNEGDEPEFTQPTMYRAIRQRESVFEGYLEHLLTLRGVTREEADNIVAQRRDRLERELVLARKDNYIRCLDTLGGVWMGYYGGPASEADTVDTAVPEDRLSHLLELLAEVPDDFKPHSKIERVLKQRREMAAGKLPLDWGTAELLAFATLVAEGRRVRMSGQDVCRGTFSQRHAVLYDSDDGHQHTALAHISRDQGPFEIRNSPLSEAGVLGFEYGYSLDCPSGLVVWEAQFGDFWNAAQVIIDQFVTSAEDKWQRLSALVMLLPHGFEGQGPEHSSARLERFLMLGADDNMQIVQPTTPAQHFHCLRRQTLRRWKKPLVVMTPKSLLRHKQAVSTLEEFTGGSFRPVLGDPLQIAAGQVKSILLCSGKVYYDLAAYREEHDRFDVAILRLEELYPSPDAELQEALKEYPAEIPVTWVQEEPENMGAWRHLRIGFGLALFGRHPFSGVYRAASASPATGSARSHRLEQELLVQEAFGEGPRIGHSPRVQHTD